MMYNKRWRRTMRLYQKLILLCLIFVIGLYVGLIIPVILTKQSRRNVGEIYWKTVSESRKLNNLSAIDKLEQFINKYPNSEYVEDAYYNICKIKFKECVKTNQNWHKPISAFHNLLNNYPKSKYLESINFFLPFCYAKNGDYLTAIKKFREFLKMFPKSDLSDEAQYNIGRLYWASGKFKSAKKAYKLVVKNYPDEDLVDEALFRIGEVYLSQGNYNEAIGQYEQVITKFPKGKISQYALSMIGFCLYGQRKIKEAKDTFLNLLSYYPNSLMKDDIRNFINKICNRVIEQELPQDKIKTHFLCTDKGIIYTKGDLLFLINFKDENMDRIFPFNTKMFFSPSGSEFIVGSGDYLWRVSINGNRKTPIAKQEGEKVNIIWSPDAKDIIYETQKSLYLIKLKENKSIKLLEKSFDTASFFPYWSKDSTKIACLNWNEEGKDLIIFDSNGHRKKTIKKIFGNYIYFSGFIWSGNSDKIAYSISRKWTKGIAEEIRVVDVDDGSVRTVIYDSAEHLCWSPDSSKIAYSNYRGTLVIDINGKNWQYLSNIRLGFLHWNSNQTLGGIGVRDGFFVYRFLNLNRQTKKITIQGTNPILSEYGNLIAYNDEQGKLCVVDISKGQKLSYSKIKPINWLSHNSKIIGSDDSNNYFIIDRFNRKEQPVYQGTPVTLLTSFKSTFIPKSYDDNFIFGNLGGNIVRLKDKTKYFLTLTGGKNPALSRNKEYVVYENADNLWIIAPDGTNKTQLTLFGGYHPCWFEDKIIFEQPAKSALNWWDFNLMINLKIEQEKGKIGKEYLLDVIQPVDSKENIAIINKDGANYTKLIKQGKNPDVSITGKIAFEREDMIWVKEERRETKLVTGKSPKWSCDGKILAYLKDNNLWIINEKEKKLQDAVEHFEWLLSKNKIAYTKNGALFMMDVYTNKTVQLTGN